MPGLAQVGRDLPVGLEHLRALVRRHDRGEPGTLVDREHGGDPVALADLLVDLAVRRRHVHDAGAVGGGDLVAAVEDPPRLLGAEPLGVGEEVEQRLVPPSHQLGPLEPGHDPLLGVLAELAHVRVQPGLGEHVALTLVLDHHVVDVGAHGDAEVGRQRPRRRRPRHDPLAGLEPEPHRQGRVLARLVDVLVHAQLVVRQRGLVHPAVRQHAETLVHQALVVQGLERPDDALHVRQVERAVGVVEVDPAGLAGDVLLPLLRVPQHRRAAGVVEDLDAHLEHVSAALDAELALGLELGGQAVGVPAEAALDPASAHRLVARDDVLDVAGEQVAVVRQAVGERRAVVEHELVRAVVAGGPVLDAGDEGAVLVPVPAHARLDLGETGGCAHLRVRHVALAPHVPRPVGPGAPGCEDDPVPSGRAAVPPRLPSHPRVGTRRPLVRRCGDGPVPSGSTEPRGRGRSSGGSPVMAGSTPVAVIVLTTTRGRRVPSRGDRVSAHHHATSRGSRSKSGADPQP